MLKDLSIKSLGRLVDLCMEASHYSYAQTCLNEMQTRLENAKAIEPNELLAELPFVETREPVLNAPKEPMLDEAKRRDVTLASNQPKKHDKDFPGIFESTTGHKHPAPEASTNEKAGPPRDENGKITRISVKVGDLGYDPEAYKNKALKIYCDGKHIEPAHTADTVLGLVRYHEKNEQGRMKTLELHGKVEIRGL